MRIHACSQYYQTRGLSLMAPNVFVGLGRTNTFVEFIDVGKTDLNLSINSEDISTWKSLIPNSNLFIFPPSADHSRYGYALTAFSWYLELHLHPGRHFIWIVLAWAFSMLSIGVVIFVLRRLEKVCHSRRFSNSLARGSQKQNTFRQTLLINSREFQTRPQLGAFNFNCVLTRELPVLLKFLMPFFANPLCLFGRYVNILLKMI